MRATPRLMIMIAQTGSVSAFVRERDLALNYRWLGAAPRCSCRPEPRKIAHFGFL